MAQSSTSTSPPARVTDPNAAAPVLDRIDDALRGLRFGTVTVIVQDGIVVQIDRTERLRLARSA